MKYALLPVALSLSGIVSLSHGAVLVQVTESGGGLVITTSGSADTTQWGAPTGTVNNSHQFTLNTDPAPNRTAFAAFGVGVEGYWYSAGAAGAFVFTDHGLADDTFATNSVALTSGGGDVGVRSDNLLVWLPAGYVAGTPINQVLTIAGATFASIGLEDGDYATLSWAGTNPDSIRIVIGAAVPVFADGFEVGTTSAWSAAQP